MITDFVGSSFKVLYFIANNYTYQTVLSEQESSMYNVPDQSFLVQGKT